MTAAGPTGRGQPPSLRLRRLAAELRALRQAAQLTRDVAARRTALNSATLWRIETARARPQRRTLLALMDLYGVVDQERRTELVTLAESAASPAHLAELPDGTPPDGYAIQVAFEAQSRRVCLFEPRVVPDLFQTERYAHAVLAGLRPEAGPEELRRLAAPRLRRQALLTADPPIEVEVVVDESALHRRVGGDRVHHHQLRRLARLARSPRVRLRVLPYHAGAHVGLHGGFTIVEFPDPAVPGLVCVETAVDVALLEGETAFATHLARFERLRAIALDPDRSLALLAELIASGGTSSGRSSGGPTGEPPGRPTAGPAPGTGSGRPRRR